MMEWADAITHVSLRRLAGAPVRGENYFAAEIVIVRLGLEQVAAVKKAAVLPAQTEPRRSES